MDPSVSSSCPSLRSPIKRPATFACVRCSERKVRCNKQNPCSACTRHNVQCLYRPPKPSRRRRAVANDPAVVERLKHYEALLREKGIDPHQGTATLNPISNGTSTCPEVFEGNWKLGPQAAVFKPRLVHGQKGTELIDNALWSRVATEIDDGDGDLGEESTNDISDEQTSDDDFSYVMGLKDSDTLSSHPPPAVSHQLWQAFKDNINPLTKLVHIPTLQPAFYKAISNVDIVPRGFEALMFSIYSIAILSLSEQECKKILPGATKKKLLIRYVAATKVALSRARFMSSTSLVVLQALMLHILCIRDLHEPRAVWTLSGVAIRVAEGMGMRLDGTLLGLPPFETEIRRRIWWQIILHDFRAAELCGQAKFRDLKLDDTTPKRPANVNDSDLYPGMQRAPTEAVKPTEMIWCLFRSELASFAASQKARMAEAGKQDDISDEYAAMDILSMHENYIKDLEDVIETKYLRFCDPTKPLQLKVLIVARLAANVVRFMAHHPRRWKNLNQVPISEQELVWDSVINLLEQYSMAQSTPQLRCFSWNIPYFIQWPAVIHVLDTLRAQPLHHDAVKAWGLIDTLYQNNLDMMLNVKKIIFVAVGNLCLKAFSARIAALTQEHQVLPDTPEYITELREQRRAARERREAVAIRTRTNGQPNQSNNDLPITTEVETVKPDENPTAVEVEADAQPRGIDIARHPSNLIEPSLRDGDDTFWLSEALDGEYSTGGAADMMDLEMDASLSQDIWRDLPADQVMDWTQWDIWLTSNDLVQSNNGL